MRRDKIVWLMVLIVSSLLLIGYIVWGYPFSRNINFSRYGTDYYGRGMMNRRFNPYNNRQNYGNKEKMSVDQIRNFVENYIQGYGDSLEMSDIFVFKDTDYYVSVEEKDTGKGAMELLVNLYTGDVYPEYGPNMMWNERYGMHGGRGYGMMGPSMIRDPRWNNNNGYYRGTDDSKQIERNEAVKIADDYVKRNIEKDFTVSNEGHEFYGYYTFHVNKSDKPVGMLSVNYYTGDVWYHDWHGQLEKIISHDEE
ncbi:hypothetical protein [Petroclostridium sp. X23]|uniref:hypothetical protein n=1 Tax=Petroclostridium sp. X23 TaxID=3045146 RepID=UPI0024ADDCDC|nr:hypothetical protein [Petroclostridium sp. X23]WHH59960.1 hypothetical protein QKW49_04205 [Petroclostridium sp. X23]